MAAHYMGTTMGCLVRWEISSVQVFADRVPMQRKVISDSTVAPALTMQGPGRIVVRSPPLSSVLLIVFSLRSTGRCSWLNGIGYCSWRRRKRGTQVAMVVRKYANERIRHILDAVKSIGNVQRVRSALTCTVGICTCTIAANNFDAGMIPQPLGQRLSGAIGQEVNRALQFAINQDGAVGMAFAECKIVDADDPWSRWCGQRALLH